MSKQKKIFSRLIDLIKHILKLKKLIAENAELKAWVKNFQVKIKKLFSRK